MGHAECALQEHPALIEETSGSVFAPVGSIWKEWGLESLAFPPSPFWFNGQRDTPPPSHPAPGPSSTLNSRQQYLPARQAHSDPPLKKALSQFVSEREGLW